MSKTNDNIRLFGLIGYPLSHSFSKKYFTGKFEKEGIQNCRYELFPLEQISELPALVKNNPGLCGLNVTIPYKEQVFSYLDQVSKEALAVGAVNTIRIENGTLKGFNTDVFGFQTALTNLLKKGERKPFQDLKAMILGTGGAAKAVAFVLNNMKIPFIYVSRKNSDMAISYEQLNAGVVRQYPLIINTTPLGMYPHVEECPKLPYNDLNEENILFDLVYNPEKTLFLKTGAARNCLVENGLEMLYLQAEKAWKIWNNEYVE